jgi:hypothetical protein
MAEAKMLDVNANTEWNDVNTIRLQRGWNNVAYLPAEELDIDVALTNWAAWENDIVKGQDGFAVYDGSQWVGTLQTLQPGKGYQVYSQTVAAFSYPTSPIEEDIVNVADFDSESTPARLHAPDSSPAPSGSLSDYDVPRRLFADNMCIVADIDDNGVVSNNERYAIGAFVGGGCRGVAQLVNGKYFIVLYGSDQEQMDFHVFDNSKHEFVETEGSALFSAAAPCILTEPTVVRITATPTSINSLTPAPSPTGEGSGNIYTLDGRKVANSTSTGRLPRGVYIVNGKKVVVK